MLEEDQEAIRKMKADFEAIAKLTEREFLLNTGYERLMNHYTTVYTAATRPTPVGASSDMLGYHAAERLYVEFQEMLTSYLLKYRDLQAPTDMLLFARILKIWKHYKILMKWNMKAFAYLSRFYIVNCSKPSLEHVALSIFFEQILKKNAQLVGRVTQELLCSERNGENVSRDQIRSALELLSFSSITKKEVFLEQFLRPYIALTEDHYNSLLSEWSGTLDSSKFVHQIEQARNEEKDRCMSCFSLEDAEIIMARVEEVLLDSSVTSDKLLMSDNGFVAVLRGRDKEALKRYYNLLSRRTKALLEMSKLITNEIVSEGEERLLQRDFRNNGIDTRSCVADMLRLQEDYLNLLADCFNNHVTVLKAIKEGLEKVFACSISLSGGRQRRVPFSELLAYYADTVLQGNGGPTEEEELERVILALTYVTDRDTFIAHLRELMATRILFPKKKFDETIEKSFIQRIRQRCGVSSTSFLEGMLHDLDIAKGFRATERLEAIGKAPSFSLSFRVLKKGIWPSRIQGESFIPPRMVQEVLCAFQQIYLEGTSGRVLTWSYSKSSGDVSAAFKNGLKTLIMTGTQCWVLLAFNDVEQMTLNDMMKLFGMSLEDLKPVLFQLIKCSLLCEKAVSATLQPQNIYTINENFSSKWKKVRVPMEGFRQERALHDGSVTKDVEEDRKPTIDACLVRIMKSRRLLNHSSLVEECHQKLLTLFSADPKLIKQRIEELIRKEYIERDQKDSSLYRYTA